MNANDFKIKFGNESNEIDVDTLISSLIYMSNLVQEVNKELDTEKKIEVKIKALEKGSFEVHIELIETIIQSLFSGDKVGYTSDIIQIVSGLFMFAKFLKGEKPKEITQGKNNSITITNLSGETTIFHDSVVNIYNGNDQVRGYIAKQFSVLDKTDDITNFEILNHKDEILTHIDREEFPLLSKKIFTEIKRTEVEVLENEKMQILRPSFSTDLNWDFIYKGTKIGAKMLDHKLVDKVDRGEKFSKGDLLVVDLEITKFYDQEYDAYMITKDSYKILDFKGHIESGKMGKLF